MIGLETGVKAGSGHPRHGDRAAGDKQAENHQGTSHDVGNASKLFRVARRTMRVVKGNLAFTAAYNVLGLSLAALGLLPPVVAAAAQSLPDFGIMANSARLLRQPANN
jgi:cation transport ATPase